MDNRIFMVEKNSFIEEKLKEYVFFKNPFIYYGGDTLITDSSPFLTIDEFVTKVFGTISDDVIQLVKAYSPYSKKELFPNPNGLFSESIFGTTNIRCACGKTNIRKHKQCPYCKSRYLGIFEQYLRIGYINLVYPVLNPIVISTVGKALFSNYSLFKQLYRGMYELGSKVILFNRERKKYENVKELENVIYYVYGSIEKFFDQNSLLTYEEMIPKLMELGVARGFLTEEDCEKIKEKYVISSPVFGIMSFILSLLSEDEIFQAFVDNEKIELSEKIYSVLLILPVFSTHLRAPFIQNSGRVIIGGLNTRLNDLVKYHELTKNIELNIEINETSNQFSSENDDNTSDTTLSLTDIIKEDLVKTIHQPIINIKYFEVYYEYSKNGIIALHEYYKKYRNSNYFKTLTLSSLYRQELNTHRTQRIVDEYYGFIVEKIKGKEGIVRSNLIGKVIDFSGRSVITPSLKIKPYEVMIPFQMAYELYKTEFIHFISKFEQLIYTGEFKPDITISKIELPKSKDEIIRYIKLKYKDLGKYIGKIKSAIFSELEFNIKTHDPRREFKIKEDIEYLFRIFVYNVNKGNIWLTGFLNRQPTLWQYSIMPYNIKINEDKSDLTIKIHPLIVESFGADFDGDSVTNCIVTIYGCLNNVEDKIDVLFL